MPQFRRRRAPPRRTAVRRYKKYAPKRITKRKVMNMVHETKYLFGQVINQSATLAGTITKLTPPAQGDNIGARDGDRIIWKNIQGKWSAVGADANNAIRFTIVQWLPDDLSDALTALSQIFQDSTSTPHISPFVLNTNARSKFRVLYDKLLLTTLTGPDYKYSAIRVPPSRFKATMFGAGLSTGRGMLYIIYVSDSGAVSHPAISASFVYRFQDF